MIAIGYVRRSKESEANTVSLEAQKAKILEYAKRTELTIRAFLEHDGVSGTKRGRFAFLDEAISNAGATCVVVYQLDRLARDSAGLGDYLRGLCKRGIELHEAAGSGKIELDRAMSRMILGIRGAVDQAYAEIIGEKTSDALKHLKQNLKRYSNIPPLGYRYEAGMMIEEPEEQRGLEIIRRCGEAGLGARLTLRKLELEGYRGRQSLKAIHQALRRSA